MCHPGAAYLLSNHNPPLSHHLHHACTVEPSQSLFQILQLDAGDAQPDRAAQALSGFDPEGEENQFGMRIDATPVSESRPGMRAPLRT
ncbi:MAG: hypothetical protein LBF91_01235 [Azoarcus sp.]|jgi:hypothetical protein|nr:hypothetical protein [Azoarcus sp.]